MTFEYELAFAKEVSDRTTRIIIVTLDEWSQPFLMKKGDLKDRTWINLASDFDRGLHQIIDTMFKSEDTKLLSFELERFDQYPSMISIARTVDNKLAQHFLKHPNDLYSLEPRKFEELIADLFSGFGYEVELTKRTRDGGRDIIAVKNSEVRVKHLIECKRYTHGKKVSVGAVRALYGVKEHYQATKAILATTAFFSKDAVVFFEDHPWELEPRDFEGIMAWLRLIVR
jgi:HJR/Mrr/RecB family endonuclease